MMSNLFTPPVVKKWRGNNPFIDDEEDKPSSATENKLLVYNRNFSSLDSKNENDEYDMTTEGEFEYDDDEADPD